ncbi:hypothetical protein MJO28_014549 [Puccinia striiformis f. sp. tritici]|uniref:Uncharacterized protein n=1 Tax=Puccinia striiformis f. sp. tritici TaxID=168172 RepID=A0ACC0DVY0_9BASI|nr:hypothetical protein MJO28_014549 [Puccinia striiformis f. sp. tritici]KAI7939685.1 hypothetical protein MJO29_014421 [Puccinia striiformis f. sp. tritici]
MALSLSPTSSTLGLINTNSILLLVKNSNGQTEISTGLKDAKEMLSFNPWPTFSPLSFKI